VGVQAAPNHVGYEHFQLQLQGLHAMTMLTWETVHGRDRAVSGKREYRVFYGPQEGSHALPWTLVVREVGEDGEHTHVHYHPYRTDAEAKKAAEKWEGPPPTGG
jgi:hypothetical protein